MAWGGKGGGWDGGGPWGAPPGKTPGSGKPPGGGKEPNRPPTPPDLEEWLKRTQERMRNRFSGNGGEGGGGGENARRGFTLLAGAAFLLWIASGVYLVRTDEVGVVMRFGEYKDTTLPGINYHWPYPFESVRTPKVTVVNRVEVGFSSARARGGRGEAPVPEESLMLTGDENIVDINFEVQWIISDAEKYLFNIRNPEETVKAVAESAMREVIGRTEIATVLAAGREQVALQTKQLLQDIMNQYNSGIEIVTVNLRDVNPPAQVRDAYLDVQSAKADAETERNQAEAYRNDIIPRARGQAEQILQDAEAYRQEVIARAQGEAARFTSVYNEYRQAPAVTRQRMYLETMESVLQGANKLITGGKGGVVPYLPLPELRKLEAKP